MNFKKINFKQPRYVIPLIILPFITYGAYDLGKKLEDNKQEITPQNELSLSLGESADSILTKNDAYDQFFSNQDNRTLLEGLEKEEDSTAYYTDNLNEKQKRYIDSLEYVKKRQDIANKRQNDERKNYYNPKQEDDYQRSVEMIRMLNREMKDNNNQSSTSIANSKNEKEEDPVSTLRRQMIMLDSLEKARDPEHIARLQAEEKLKKNKEKMQKFLNSTLTVKKAVLSNHFNTIAKEKENNFIRAVIDENTKGVLGSRIPIRLLEDVLIGKHKLEKGTILYSQISGFTMQRVNLNIVSVLHKGEILPINLSIYDNDGIQGLYVPASAFREMMREMGANSIQGTQMDSSGEGFFTSFFSKMFQSTSQTIANLIRKNKVKLKYNSYLYLINEKDIKQNEN